MPITKLARLAEAITERNKTEEVQFMSEPKRAAQYNNTRVESAGYSFSSKLEAAVYQLLFFRIKAGEVKSIQVQAHVYLTDARVLYIPDFKCEMADGSTLYVEAKGFESPIWPMKKKLWRHYGPSKLEIWKGSHSRPNLVETITPKPSQAYEAWQGCTSCLSSVRVLHAAHENESGAV